MPNIVAALLLVSAGSTGALDLGGTGEVGHVFKCGSRTDGDPGMPETAVIIDHKPFAGDPSEWDHTQHDIYWVEIVCWSWVEEQLGIKIRSGAIYVLTKAWVERMRRGSLASLEAVLAGQEHLRRARGAYAGQLHDLPGFGELSDYGLPGYVKVELRATDDGWEARVEATESWLAGFRHPKPELACFAFVGTPPIEWSAIRREDSGPLMERQPACIEPFTEDDAGGSGA